VRPVNAAIQFVLKSGQPIIWDDFKVVVEQITVLETPTEYVQPPDLEALSNHA
jgi:hypothetical protein